jgi:hypothetical protein
MEDGWLTLCHCVAHDNNPVILNNEVPNDGYILGSLNDHDNWILHQC